jgi:hypothetical protein
VDSRRLEARVLRIVELVSQGRTVEDDRVELKAEWPESHYKAARHIAGLANASRGEDVLWIVGLDEKSGVVDSLAGVEFADWWNQVARHFNEQAPDPNILSVPVGAGAHVIALLFDTGRAPYVITIPDGGSVTREVPWRANNATRSAHRRELLSTVVAQARVPELELVSGAIRVSEVEPYSGTGSDDDPTHEVTVEAIVFVSATDEAMLPQHRQSWTAVVDGSEPLPLFASLRGPFLFSSQIGRTGLPGRADAGIIDVLEHSGLVIRGSGEVAVTARAHVRGEEVRKFEQAPWVELNIHLPLDRSGLACDLQVRFDHVPGSKGPDEFDHSLSRRLAEFRPTTK